MKQMSIIFRKISLVAMLLAVNQIDLCAQHLHYSTLSGYCEDAEENGAESCEEPPCHCPHKNFRWRDRDPIAEEEFDAAGWPGRRDDELSDQLMR